MPVSTPTPTLQQTLGVMGNTRHVYINDGESALFIERFTWPDAVNFNQDVTGAHGIVDVGLQVFDEDGAGSDLPIYTATPNLGTTAVLFVALQTDGYWTLDATGYNFRYILPYTFANVDGGHIYRAEFTFNPHSGNGFGLKREAFYVHVAAMGSG